MMRGGSFLAIFHRRKHVLGVLDETKFGQLESDKGLKNDEKE